MQIQMSNRGLLDLGGTQNGGAKELEDPIEKINFKSMVKKAKTTLSKSDEEPIEKRRSFLEEDDGSNTDTKTKKGAAKSNAQKDTRKKEGKVNAVQKFMDSLESKLGISAERFSAALAQLPSEISSLPIDESASYVIEELGIPESNHNQVLKTYFSLMNNSGLLDQNQASDNNKAIPLNAAESDLSKTNLVSNVSNQSIGGIEDQVLNSSSIKNLTPRQKLNATIDEMNRRFFDAQAKPLSQRNSDGSMVIKNEDEVYGFMKDKADPKTLMDQINNPVFNQSDQMGSAKALNQDPKSEFNLNDLDIKNTENNIDSELMNPQSEIVGPYNLSEIYDPMGKSVLSNDELIQYRNSQNLKNNLNKTEIVNNNQSMMSLDKLRNLISNQELTSQTSELPITLDSEFGSMTRGSEGLNSNQWSVEELPFLSPFEFNKMTDSSANNENLFNSQQEFNQQGSDSLTSKGMQGLTKNKKDKTEKEEDINQLLNEFNLPQDGTISKNNQEVNSNLKMNINSTSLTPQDRIQNIQKLSEAAEALSVKGGGEVKVRLNPEGLGSVQLKVRLQEGKIQVELKAENKETQKVLESSLGELKNSLQASHIKLDSVKVDVGGEYARRENQNNFQQPQMDFNRDQAGQFMNAFREGNLYQRQNLFEMPGFQTYRSQNQETLAPISEEIRPRSSLNVNKGRDLNLVV